MGAKNWVLEGDYKHKAVIMQGGKAVLNVGLMKNLKLDSSTIDQIEVVDEDSQKSMGSAVARGAAGALLLGPLGVFLFEILHVTTLLQFLFEAALKARVLGALRGVDGPFQGVVTRNQGMDEHSSLRVLRLVDERLPVPMSRDEVAAEAIFQGLRIVQVVEDVDLVGRPDPDRLRTAVEVPAIVAGVDDVFFGANLPGLVTGEAAFADDQFVHDLRYIGLKGDQGLPEVRQSVQLHSHRQTFFV